MPRPDRMIWVTAATAALVSGVTWGVWITTLAAGALTIAVAVQLVAGVASALVTDPERRWLAAVLSSTVPVLGPIAGGWVAEARGRGGAELLATPTEATHVDGLAIARRLTASLPSCEALVSGGLEARRATISRLARRAAPADIAILRWARGHDDPDVAVEVALALEEVGVAFEQRVYAARAAAIADPSFASHAAVVRVISAGALANVIDIPVLRKLAVVAREHYAAAIALEPNNAPELVAAQARLELEVRRPVVARDLLAAVLQTTASDELIALHNEAAYAARRFEKVSHALA